MPVRRSPARFLQEISRVGMESSTQHRPASTNALKALETLMYEKGSTEVTEGTCAICQDDYECGQELSRLPCKHDFHSACVLPWLKKVNTCPSCRHELEAAPNPFFEAGAADRAQTIQYATNILETLFDLSLVTAAAAQMNAANENNSTR